MWAIFYILTANIIILKEIYLKSIENNEKIKHILLIMENIGLIELENNEKITSLWINQNNIKEETYQNDLRIKQQERLLPLGGNMNCVLFLLLLCLCPIV